MTTRSQAAVSAQDSELTDEQVEELLAQATIRLQEKAKSQELAKREQKQSYSFPKLDTGALEKPYVTSKGDIATLDQQRLLDGKDHKQHFGIRKVEDPVQAKKAAIEVRASISCDINIFAMRKINPKHFLSRVRAPFWSPFCTLRAL